MKKLLALILAFTTVFSASVFAGTDKVNVKCNGDDVTFENQQPTIIDNRTLIPLRGVFDKMGYEITWDANTKTATFEKDETVINVTANTSTYNVNGQDKTMDVCAQIINSSMMVPLRAIGEATGAKVEWDEKTRTATINEMVKSPSGFSLEVVGSGYDI